MARPRKEGLDYFPMDVYFDEKVGFIEGLYGADGIYVWLKLLQRIYEKGYYLEWTKVTTVNLKRDSEGVSVERIQEIVEACIEAKLFDEDLYNEYQVLTSRGIQKRYFEVAKRREEVEIIEKYVLFEKMKRYFCKATKVETQKNPNRNHDKDEVSSEEIQQKQDENPSSCEVSESITHQKPDENDSYCGVSATETQREPDGNETELLQKPDGNKTETQQKSDMNLSFGEVSATEVHTRARGKHSIAKNSIEKNSKAKKSKAEKKRAPAPPKVSYAEHVTLTEVEYQKIVDELGDSGAKWVVEYLNDYKIGYGKEKAYKSDYHVMRNWVISAYRERLAKGQIPIKKENAHKKNEEEFADRDWNKW